MYASSGAGARPAFWLKVLDPKRQLLILCHRWHMSVRRAVQHGVTVGAHTDVQILHSAAVVDFLSHIRALLEDGQSGAAAVLWNSVAEIVHVPVPERPVQEFKAPPPMRRITCSEAGCDRCSRQQGGFRFPWLGTWTRRFVVVQPGLSPRSAWLALGDRTETMDRLVVESLASGYYLRDLVPSEWDMLVARAVDAPGCAKQADVFRAYGNWQLGHELWRDPCTAVVDRQVALRCDRGRAQRSLAGWIRLLVVEPDFHIPAPCFLCGGPTRQLCVGCLLPFCAACTLSGTDRPCCEEDRAQGDLRLEVPALRFGESTGRIFQRLIRQHAAAASSAP